MCMRACSVRVPELIGQSQPRLLMLVNILDNAKVVRSSVIKMESSPAHKLFYCNSLKQTG